MPDRRRFLTAGLMAWLASQAGAAWPAHAAAGQTDGMRGPIDALVFDRQAGETDSSARLTMLLAEAFEQDKPVHLPAGDYVVSDLALPPRVRLSGVPGATRLVHGGGRTLMRAEGSTHITLSGLTFDGTGHPNGPHPHGLVTMRDVTDLVVDNCRLSASGGHGLYLDRCSGRVERSSFSHAAGAGLFCLDAGRMAIAGNNVHDCANGGILVHRRQSASDGTMITGNRIERIAARQGGTGQNGNGINLFRAGDVSVSANSIAECAFSAIRANGAHNIQITGNRCLRSGETAIYSEFAFQGAQVSSNIVDGAANGISIVNFNDGGRLAICAGNLVRNLRLTGPYRPDPPGFGAGVTVEADCVVSGNVIEGAPLYGIGIGWGAFMRNVTCTGNVIRQSACGIAVSLVEGTGPAVIANNIIDGASAEAIVGHHWGRAVTGDLARTGAQDHQGLIVKDNLSR